MIFDFKQRASTVSQIRDIYGFGLFPDYLWLKSMIHANFAILPLGVNFEA